MDVTLVSQDLFDVLYSNKIDILDFTSFLNCNSVGQGMIFFIIWNRLMSIAVCVNTEEKYLLQQTLSILASSRISVILYDSISGSCPVNKLRNLAIHNANTTHVWITDLNIWPSSKYNPELLFRLFVWNDYRFSNTTFGW